MGSERVSSKQRNPLGSWSHCSRKLETIASITRKATGWRQNSTHASPSLAASLAKDSMDWRTPRHDKNTRRAGKVTTTFITTATTMVKSMSSTTPSFSPSHTTYMLLQLSVILRRSVVRGFMKLKYNRLRPPHPVKRGLPLSTSSFSSSSGISSTRT